MLSDFQMLTTTAAGMVCFCGGEGPLLSSFHHPCVLFGYYYFHDGESWHSVNCLSVMRTCVLLCLVTSFI